MEMLAKIVPKKLIDGNKSVLKCLGGIPDPFPPHFQVMAVTDTKKKVFDLMRVVLRLHNKFKDLVPLMPERFDNDESPVSCPLRPKKESDIVWEVVLDGQSRQILVFEWIVSPVEDLTAGVDGFLSLPGTTNELFRGCTDKHCPAPLIYMVKLFLAERKKEQRWTSRVKAKVLKVAKQMPVSGNGILEA